MTIRISKSSNIASLFDVGGNLINNHVDLVSGTNPIKTEHSGDGQSTTKTLHLFNDGFRDQLNLDGSKRAMALTYKNIKIIPKGVSTTVNSPGVTIGTNESTDIKFSVQDASRYNKGTKLWLGGTNSNVNEMVIVEDVVGNQLTVTRKQGSGGVIAEITHGMSVQADTGHVALTDNNGVAIPLSGLYGQDINDDKVAHAFTVTVTTPALPTQVKSDVYLEITADEYPRL